MGGRNITFVDLEVGDWDDERSTCTGATGGLDILVRRPRETRPVDCRCIPLPRHRVPAGASAPTAHSEGKVTDSAFRSGNPAERRGAFATGVVGLCDFGLSACEIDPGAREVVFERNVCDEYPTRPAAARAGAPRPPRDP